MSFVDMMASDVWSSADIDNKVQALIRSRYSAQDELKASRLARTPNPSETDAAFVASVDAWIAECVAEGRAARADMLVLAQVLDMEVAKRRLDIPQLEPVLDEEDATTNQAEIDADESERADAQAVLDGAPPDVRAWFDLRNPLPPADDPELQDPVVEQLESIP
jgi:hypothetical protein